MRTLSFSALVLALVALVAASAAYSASRAPTINVGYIGDKSGPTSGTQIVSLRGLETGIKYINSHGGINGSQINLIEKDDQYNATQSLSLVKSLINDDHVSIIAGLGQTTAFASIAPVLDQTHTIGQSMQAVLHQLSWPFNPWLFAGSCSYADQTDIGIAYEMKHLKLKSLKGVNVGVAAVQSASGQEVIDEATKIVQKYGGNAVPVDLPPALVSADVQVQDMQAKNVKFVVVLHGIAQTITLLRSMDKYNLDVPVVLLSANAEEPVFTTAPYSVTKNAVGVGCADPLYDAKTAAAKAIATYSAQAGIASPTDLKEANFVGGWVNAMIIGQALKNAHGDYSPAGIKKGYEMIKNFDPAGGMTPLLSFGSKCHIAWPNPRPYLWNYNKKGLQPIGAWSEWASADTKPHAPPGTCGVPRGTKS